MPGVESRGTDLSVRAPYAVLYDGACGLCSWTVRMLRALDVRGRLRFVDINRDWDQLVAAHPSLDAAACAAALHVVDPRRRITAGFDGLRTIARVIPPLWLVLPLLYVPGIPPIGRRAYDWVARHRPTTCTIPHGPG